MAVRNPAIAVLHRQAKQGLGRAYVAAFKELIGRGADIVVQIDADFSHPVRYLPSLLEPLRTGQADLVLGLALRQGRPHPALEHPPPPGQPRRQRLRRRRAPAAVSAISPAASRPGARASSSEIDLDRLHAGGYAFQIETTFKARLAGARIVEVPITFEERRAGQSKMSMNIFMEAFLLVLALRVANLRRRKRTRPGSGA